MHVHTHEDNKLNINSMLISVSTPDPTSKSLALIKKVNYITVLNLFKSPGLCHFIFNNAFEP